MATSYLFLGSGDYSVPWNFAKAHSVSDAAKANRWGLSGPIDPSNEGASRTLQNVTITATELRTRAETEAIYRAISEAELDRVQDNMRNIGLIGESRLQGVADTTSVIGGFDATRYPPGTPNFDRIIFENPHSGTYGRDGDGVQNMRAVESNTGLLQGVIREARNHLTLNGYLEVSVCGWPFIAKPSRQDKWEIGMDLSNEDAARAFAQGLNMQITQFADMGTQWVTRNNGDRFQAQVIRLRFARA